MGQKAFYFDMKKCAGCHACEVACRDRNALYNVGELFRKVDLYEGGKYPKPWMYFLHQLGAAVDVLTQFLHRRLGLPGMRRIDPGQVPFQIFTVFYHIT